MGIYNPIPTCIAPGFSRDQLRVCNSSMFVFAVFCSAFEVNALSDPELRFLHYWDGRFCARGL